MNYSEIAMQLTLKLIEHGKVYFQQKYANDTKEQIEEINAFNAKQVSDAFNSIMNEICQD